MSASELLAYASAAVGGVADADKKHMLDCLDRAAVDFVRQTLGLRDVVSLDMAEDQTAYDLPPDFLEPYVRDEKRRLYAKYVTDDVPAKTVWPVLTSYEKLFMSGETDAKTPDRFAIRTKPEAGDRWTGTATADGVAANGETRLTDAAADFAGVAVRDRVLNTTDGSSGMVVEAVSGIALETVLFGGTNNAWTTGDAYVIVPAPRRQVVLEVAPKIIPPTDPEDPEDPFVGVPSLTLPYLVKPVPVYSDKRAWQIPEESWRPIAMEAVFNWLIDYDYDRKDDRFHGMFLEEIRKVKLRRGRERLQGGGYLRRR